MTMQYSPTNQSSQTHQGTNQLPATIKLNNSQLSPKAQAVKTLSKNIPRNHLGLPEYFYQCDLLPDMATLSQLPSDEAAHFQDQALRELNYDQGFPTLNDGEPFWSQLPHEPKDAFIAFAAYLDSTRASTEVGVRQLHLLKDELVRSTQDLLNFANLYYWQARAQAYDLFSSAVHQKRKEARLRACEDRHYTMADQLLGAAFGQLQDAMGQTDEDGIPLVKPSDLIKLMGQMMGVQRLSAGANPNSNFDPSKSEGALSQGAPLEITLRQIAEKSGMLTPTTIDNQGESDSNIKEMLSNPDDLQNAQELIIKINGLNNPRKHINQIT